MPRVSGPVDPSRSLWHLLGAVLRHWRECQDLSLKDVAKEVLVDWSLLGRWERGERPVPRDVVKRLDDYFGGDGVLIALREVALTGSASTPVAGTPNVQDAVDMDKLRRKLLAGVAMVGVSAVVPPMEGLEHLRAVVDHNVGASGLSEWEEVAWEYGLQMASRPPAMMIADLSLDYLAFQQAMVANASGHDMHRWRRLNARFAFVLADALGSAGHARESRRWWGSARRAAEQADDHEAMALVYASEAVQGLYEDRPAALVLSRVDSALALTSGRPCQATARALGARAHALALVGDHASAHESLDQQARVFDALPDRVTRDELSMDGWPEFRLLHTRSLVYALSGHSAAARAQREALAAHPSGRPRPTVQVRLHEAISAVRDGDVEEVLEQARRTVEGLGTNVNWFVLRTAQWVADAVPPRERSRSAVIDYREQLTLSRGET
ncbi:helix-turn-helix domain-containing protein [Streptosporangium sp. NBC_01469]|uniref:helix-turn-helix domain-containing protein n=1 Tax=Streptosporangium sp. NBC_01469 TaxID=2903898 RepID=UPI002E29A243|nr:helix-turn-helix transcriptional regulator [Streptosporangium sp. NBC_01469]